MAEAAPLLDSLIEEEAEPLLRLIRTADWQDKPIPIREWAWQDWIPTGVVTGLGGAGGASKSTLMQQLCTHKVLGVQFLEMPLDAAPALFVSCEDDESELHRRQARIDTAMGCEMRDHLELYAISRVGEESMLVATVEGRMIRTKLFDELDQLMGDLDIKLLGLDLIPDFWDGNENDRQRVNAFVKAHLAYFAQRHSAGVVALYHPSRSGQYSGTGESGSTAWDGSFRSRLYLHMEEDSDHRILSRKKANYASLIDEKLVWQDGYLTPLMKLGRSASDQREEGWEEAFKTCLHHCNANGIKVTRAPNSGNYFGKNFPKLWQQLDGRRKEITRKQFEIAYMNLELKLAITTQADTRNMGGSRVVFRES